MSTGINKRGYGALIGPREAKIIEKIQELLSTPIPFFITPEFMLCICVWVYDEGEFTTICVIY